MSGWVDRPRIDATQFGKPYRCPKDRCGFRILKTPQTPFVAACPNCGAALEPVRRKA